MNHGKWEKVRDWRRCSVRCDDGHVCTRVAAWKRRHTTFWLWACTQHRRQIDRRTERTRRRARR